MPRPGGLRARSARGMGDAAWCSGPPTTCSTKHEAIAWITRLERIAAGLGGVLEWHTRPIKPGR
eukprot:3597553-Lingulodinium_polyedra.AAC.1